VQIVWSSRRGSRSIEHRTPRRLGGGSLLGLAVADLSNAVTAELAGVAICGRIYGLQMAQFVKPQAVGVGELEHRRVPLGRQCPEEWWTSDRRGFTRGDQRVMLDVRRFGVVWLVLPRRVCRR
jgi:hypothetical protein